MFSDYNASITQNDQQELLGLRISAVLLVLLGCHFGLFVSFFVLVFVDTVIRDLQGHVPASEMTHSFAGLLIAIGISSALTYLCFRAARDLREAQRWAAFVAMGFGLLSLLFSGSFVYDMFHPERQSPDEEFGLLFIPFFLAIGLWWCVYLNLPHVRARLRRIRTN
jgi:hypothetical protein